MILEVKEPFDLVSRFSVRRENDDLGVLMCFVREKIMEDL
jgi:hypothetical protein